MPSREVDLRPEAPEETEPPVGGSEVPPEGLLEPEDPDEDWFLEPEPELAREDSAWLFPPPHSLFFSCYLNGWSGYATCGIE